MLPAKKRRFASPWSIQCIARDSDEGRYHVTERAYGFFERILPLPTEVDDADARASYRKGVLTVTLPKHKNVVARKIDVRGG